MPKQLSRLPQIPTDCCPVCRRNLKPVGDRVCRDCADYERFSGELLVIHLSAAVPLEIMKLKQLFRRQGFADINTRVRAAQERITFDLARQKDEDPEAQRVVGLGQAIAWLGDEILYRTPHPHQALGMLVYCMALLSFAPGGCIAFGRQWSRNLKICGRSAALKWKVNRD